MPLGQHRTASMMLYWTCWLPELMKYSWGAALSLDRIDMRSSQLLLPGHMVIFQSVWAQVGRTLLTNCKMLEWAVKTC